MKVQIGYNSNIIYNHPIKSAAEQVAKWHRENTSKPEITTCPVARDDCIKECICFEPAHVIVTEKFVSGGVYPCGPKFAGFEVTTIYAYCSNPALTGYRFIEQT